MTARRKLFVAISRQNAPQATHRQEPGGGQGFRFDPDAWIELAYPCREEVWVDIGGKEVRRQARFTREGFEAMIAGFEADKADRAAEGVEHSLLGNKDHLALRRDSTTEAVGWLDGLKIGDDGHLWGHVKWSSLGMDLGRGGVYRFVSVEVEDTDTPETDKDAVLVWNRITGFAVTNQPALQKLRPYCHREGEAIENKETNQPKGKHAMDTIKQILGLDPSATEADVEAKIRDLMQADEAAKAATAEAEMRRKAASFAKKHGSKFPDEAAAAAFYRDAPEKAEALVARFRTVQADVDADAQKLETDARAFAAKHAAKFVDEKGAVAFFKAQPEQADTLVEHIRVPAVSHRTGGHPDGAGSALSARAAYSKYTAMPEGEEKEKFFDAHVALINEGEGLEKQG